MSEEFWGPVPLGLKKKTVNESLKFKTTKFPVLKFTRIFPWNFSYKNWKQPQVQGEDVFLVRSREHHRRPVQTSHHEWHHFSVAPAFLHSSLPVSFAHSVCSLRTLTSSLAIWLWPNPKWALFSFNSSSLLSIIYSLNCEAQWDSSNLFLATWNCCAQITIPRKKPPEGPRLLISKV